MKITTTNELPKDGCWIFANKQYTCSVKLPHLPSVDANWGTQEKSQKYYLFGRS